MESRARNYPTPEWRNWQTHGTQNPAPFTGHVGSTPTSGTNRTLSGHAEHYQGHIIMLRRGPGERLCGGQDSPRAFDSR